MKEEPRITQARAISTAAEGIKKELRERQKKVLVPLPEPYYDIAKNLTFYEPSFWNKVFIVIKKLPAIISIAYKFIILANTLKEGKMKQDKTTFMATLKVIMGIIVAIVGIFGIGIPEEVQTAIMAIAASGYFLFSWLQGLFTKDKADEPKP